MTNDLNDERKRRVEASTKLLSGDSLAHAKPIVTHLCPNYHPIKVDRVSVTYQDFYPGINFRATCSKKGCWSHEY